MISDIHTATGTRRQILQLIGGTSVAAGGLALLSGCNDDIVGAESVPAPIATSTPVSVPPAYTATDTDRLNFALQIHYLFASYLQISLDGSGLPANLVTGSGTAGSVTGGRQVAFTDSKLLAIVVETTASTIARVAYLRRTLGDAVTARPAISFATGQGSAFQAIAEPASTTPPTSYYDPFASENNFLLGAVSFSAVITSAMDELAWQMGGTLRASFAALSAGVAATDSALRNILFTRAAAVPSGQPSLFSQATRMANARNPFDGPGARDGNIGSSGTAPNIGITDGANWVAIRRSPEQALGILYTSTLSVSAGGFFPAGLNGTIKVSGANS